MPPGASLPTLDRATRTISLNGTAIATTTTSHVADLLPVTQATIEYYKREANGTLTPFFGTATASGTKLVAVHTFCKFAKVTIGAKTYAFGVKTFIRADFQLKSGSSNLSLFGIGAQASANKIDGTIQVSVEGITGKSINDYISMPARLDETTILKAVEDFAVIKSKLYEADTVLVPTIIGAFES